MNLFRLKNGNCTNQKFNGSALLTIALGLACFALSPRAQAVSPAPDGAYPGGNTAEGQKALFSLTTGGFNTAVGWLSLETNSTGQFNTGVGAGTLALNTADENTAIGTGALFSNTTGAGNTADGLAALASNTTGTDNTATGIDALGSNTTGSSNTALGLQAGLHQTTGSNNVYIGAGIVGDAGENNTCRIASIFEQTIDPTTAAAVEIDIHDKLGTVASSRRFKHDIKPMGNASEALFSLKPVSFRYKKEIDPAGKSQFGLVAEDVENVNPNLIVRDKEGKAYSVRYDQVNAMLLNEFLKEHRKTEKLEATVAEQQKQIKALTAGLQKVSAQIELNKPAPRTAQNAD